MSRIPRTKSRSIVVGGRTFRWLTKGGKSRYRGDSNESITVIVQEEAERPGVPLRSTLLSKAWLANPDYADDNAFGHKAAVTPADVRSLIEAGLASGWEPSARGTTFAFNGPLDLPAWTFREKFLVRPLA